MAKEPPTVVLKCDICAKPATGHLTVLYPMMATDGPRDRVVICESCLRAMASVLPQDSGDTKE